MILVRADWPMDRLDDALLVCDALAAHAPAYVRDGRLAFTVASGPAGVELRVEALAEQGAHGLLSDATVPGVGNVLERMSDEQRVIPGAGGSGEALVLTLSRG
jgi:serine/threonine-protein kinase RsbW